MANYYNDTTPHIGEPYTGTVPPPTTSGTVPESLVLKSWAKKTWEAGIKESYFSKFMGRDAKSIIHVKEELNRGRGTSINIPLLMPLVGAGVIEDNMLEGKEESLVYRDFDVPLSRVRHAVRLAGEFEERKTQLNMRQDAHTGLSQWLGKYIDLSIFGIMTGTTPPFIKAVTDLFPFTIDPPTADRIVCSNGEKIDSTNTTLEALEATIEAADVFDTSIIGKAKRLARADEVTAIRPIRVDGRETYVMVIDQWQARDLKRDTKWIEAQKHANIRGEKNPIFSGAIGIWDGVVIHECNRVPRTETGKNGVPIGHALFLGAQAVVFAEGEPAKWVEKKFDFDNQYGVAISRMFGLKKAQFKFDGTNWTDFGVINVLTSSVED